MGRGPDLAKRAAWRRRFREFERSAETVAEFCDRVGKSPKTFHRWRRMLAPLAAAAEGGRTPSARSTPARVTPARATSAPGASRAMSFLPIEIAAAAKLEVLFPNGVRMSLPCQDHEVIRTVLSSLLAAETAALREDHRC